MYPRFDRLDHASAVIPIVHPNYVERIIFTVQSMEHAKVDLFAVRLKAIVGMYLAVKKIAIKMTMTTAIQFV